MFVDLSRVVDPFLRWNRIAQGLNIPRVEVVAHKNGTGSARSCGENLDLSSPPLGDLACATNGDCL